MSKKVSEIAYASTIVKQGEMLALVVNTGARTNFHTVVALVATAELEQRSHFQEMVVRIGNFLILITVAIVAVIVMVSLFRTPVGWEYALWMWVYALAWFLVNDLIKLGVYRYLRPRDAQDKRTFAADRPGMPAAGGGPTHATAS